MSAFRHITDIISWIKAVDRRVMALERMETAVGGATFTGARYTISSSYTFVNNSLTITNFDGKTWDTHDAVTTGTSWKFTAPEAGYYKVTFNLRTTSSTSWAENEVFYVRLYKNGAWVSEIGFKSGLDSSGVATANSVNGSDTIYLAADDYIDLRYYQNCGNSLGRESSQSNFIEIIKVG